MLRIMLWSKFVINCHFQRLRIRLLRVPNCLLLWITFNNVSRHTCNFNFFWEDWGSKSLSKDWVSWKHVMFWHWNCHFGTGFRIRSLFRKLHLLILQNPTYHKTRALYCIAGVLKNIRSLLEESQGQEVTVFYPLKFGYI